MAYTGSTNSANSANSVLSSLLGVTAADVPTIAYQVAWTMRVEITFVLGFIFFWMTGFFAKKASPRKEAIELQKQRVAQGPSAGVKAQPAVAVVRRFACAEQDKRQSDDGAAKGMGQKEMSTLLEKLPDVAHLKDSTWLAPRLTQLCTNHAQRALILFRAALDAGVDLNQSSEAEREPMLVALVTSLIRLGLLDDTLRLLRDFKRHGILVSSSLHVSVVKLCTAKHHFKECLTIHDLLAENGSHSADKNLWSCLLFCSTEAAAHHRCPTFFDQLKVHGVPTEKDYWNMIRVCSSQGDWKLTLKLVQGMREQGFELVNVIYNTALATCVSAHQLDEARKLLEEMNHVVGVADVITYNTIMKGYASCGGMDECFKLYELMRERGINPSPVTYGILLDGCINNKQVDRAAQVFDTMTKEGCQMNTILYTTLIKGFAREGKVDDAMRIYEHMSSDKGVAPDVITFSVLLKANCDADRLEKSLDLLSEMTKVGLQPDEVIFNNLLAGCAKQANSELAKRLYGEMVDSGLKPSNATFSILIRLYSQCKALDEAVEMLRTQPQKYKVEIESRLYSQLIQCCIRARQGRRAAEVYEMMVKSGTSSPAVHSSMLGMCIKLNMLDTAVELLELAAANRCRVDAADCYQVLEAACKKRKGACAESCAASMRAMGIAVEPVM